MLLGTRLWYGFFGETVQSDAKFQAKMDELCREIGPPQCSPPAQPVGTQLSAVAPTVAPDPAPTSAQPKSASASAPTTARPAAPASAADDNIVSQSHSGSPPEPNPTTRTESVGSVAVAPVSVSTAPTPSHSEDIVQPQPQRHQQLQLSEAFYLERERAAERAERERAERIVSEREFRVFSAVIAFSVSTCTCGVGAAILGAALLLRRK